MEKNILKDDEKYFKSLIEQMNGFTKDYPGDVEESIKKSSRTTYSIIDFEYNSSAFSELLIQEDYIEDKEEAYALMRMICTETLKKFYEPLLEKRFNERLTYINNQLETTVLTPDLILGNTLIQKYIETEYIILGLDYEKVSPLILFDDFISFYNVPLLIDKETHSFRYHFTRDTPLKKPIEDTKWYTAKNLYEMCEHFYSVLLEPITSSFLETIELVTNPVAINLKEFIDTKYMLNKSPQEVYDYLKNIEMARLALPLHYTYLLLNFKDFPILKDEAIMNRIAEALLEEEPEPEPEIEIEPDEEKEVTFASLRKIILKIVEEQSA